MAKPMSLDIAKASEPDASLMPQPDLEGSSTPSPDSGYASTTTTPERTPQCVQGELELPTGKLFKRKNRLKVFEEEISPQVKDRFLDLQELFNRPLYERLVSSGKSLGPMSLKLKKLGESEQTSAYWLIIQCEPKMARHVRKFFDQEHVKSEYQPRNELGDLPWFNIWVCPEPLRQLAMDYEADGEIYIDLAERTLCGALVKVQDRIATIGGVIMVTVNGEASLYCLTAGHVLSNARGSAGMRDAEDDEGGEDSSDAESEANFSSDEFELESASEFDSGEEQILGNFDFANLQPRPIRLVEEARCKTKRCSDWALAAFCEAANYRPNCLISEFMDQNIRITHTRKSGELRETCQRSTRLAVSRRVMVLGGVRGYRFGQLSESPSSYFSQPSNSFEQMYTLKLGPKSGKPIRNGASTSIALGTGDSGSWIVDPLSSEVYGHVVASDIFGEVYVAPLKVTLRQVEEVLMADSVSLPTRNEVAEWVEARATHSAYKNQTHATELNELPSPRVSIVNQFLASTGLDPSYDSTYGSKLPSPCMSDQPDSGYSSKYNSPYLPSSPASRNDMQETSQEEPTGISTNEMPETPQYEKPEMSGTLWPGVCPDEFQEASEEELSEISGNEVQETSRYRRRAMSGTDLPEVCSPPRESSKSRIKAAVLRWLRR